MSRRTRRSAWPTSWPRSEHEGLGWDARTQTGAVFHMLSLLEPQGRLGVTAIDDSLDGAQQLYLRVVELLDRMAGRAAAR